MTNQLMNKMEIEANKVFISGEAIYESEESIPEGLRALLNDPRVIEFERSGRVPEWDVQSLLNDLPSPKKDFTK